MWDRPLQLLQSTVDTMQNATERMLDSVIIQPVLDALDMSPMLDRLAGILTNVTATTFRVLDNAQATVTALISKAKGKLTNMTDHMLSSVDTFIDGIVTKLEKQVWALLKEPAKAAYDVRGGLRREDMSN